MSELVVIRHIGFLVVALVMLHSPAAVAQGISQGFAGLRSGIDGQVRNLRCPPGSGQVLLRAASGDTVSTPSRLLSDGSFQITGVRDARVYRLTVYCGAGEVASGVYTREELAHKVELWANNEVTETPATGVVDARLWTGRGPREARRALARSRRLRERGDLTNAVACAEQALEAAPGWFDAVTSLGVLYVRAAQYDKAEELLGRVVEHMPNEARAWSNWGLALWGTRRFDEAIEALDRSLVLEPGNQVIRRERAKAVEYVRTLSLRAAAR